MGKTKNKKRKATTVKSPIVKPKTRKDLRKEKRQLKKVKKQEYFSKGLNVGKYVRAPEPEEEKVEDNITANIKDTKKKKLSHKSDSNIIHQENLGAKKREQKLKNEMKETRNNQLIKANEEEDKIIKKLEKQLKIKKKSGIAKSFAEDGLGYLLEVCDEKTMCAAVTAEKHLANTESGSDFEEDFAIATGKANILNKKKKQNSQNKLRSDEDFDDFDMNNSEDDELENLSSESEEDEDTDVAMSDEMNDDSFSDDNDDDHIEDESLEEEMDEDEEGIIFSGMSTFPDDSFQPGNLTPVKEETDQELTSYLKNIDTSPKQNNPSKKLSTASKLNKTDSDEENVLDLNSENEKIFHSESEDKDDADNSDFEHYESSENSCSSDFESNESECSDPECFSDEDESEKGHIVVNGKIVNTYGRHVPDDVEPDIVRCPILDEILANISDSDGESSTKPKSTTSYLKSEEKSKKENLKRKLNQSNESTKKKSKLESNAKTILDSKKVKSEKVKRNKANEKMNDESILEEEDMNESDFSFDSDEPSEGEELSHSNEDESKKHKVNKDGSWEDIYGRKRDKDGNVMAESGKYIPPRLRGKEDNAENIQLKRQIKGLLNKVAGSNMHWTSSQMESIYSSNSRNAVNNAFCSLWLSALVQHTVTPDRMAAEHAMLVAVLHANVGSEVGAHFLQTVIKQLDDLIGTNHQLQNKEMDNLVLAISQLYNFKIFQASLLYEILTKLMEKLTEKSIECTLVVLRNVGGVLRKEDPAALKGFIHATQEKAVNFKHGTSDGSRMKFLLDVLMAIKNNNMNKIPNYDPSYAEELKKALKGIIRKGNYSIPLNIKLEDLLKADEKGRWWVVGSAWEGSSNQDKDKDTNNTKVKDKSDKKQAQLMELAKKQRINTELRRSIFCVIMSAEDYMDCFEKLQQLGLKSQQDKEIVHVLLSCCLQEKVYNPYYAILAQKLCDYDRKYQLSIQFKVWDKLKEIDSCAAFQIANLAQFLTHLFNEKGLPISILKVVQFSDLTKSNLRLVRQILLAVLLQKSSQNCVEVFQRVAISPKLHMFREGLRLFISHFLLKNSDKKESVLEEDETSLLKERAAAVDKTLSSDSKLRF